MNIRCSKNNKMPSSSVRNEIINLCKMPLNKDIVDTFLESKKAWF